MTINQNLRLPYVDLAASYLIEQKEILDICDKVFKSGRLVLGEALWSLESELTDYIGGGKVIALRSGTDALIIALKAAGIGPGDEVITAPNSFIATAGAIVAVGATPKFVDVAADMNINPSLIEAQITDRTKAIVPVHLTGRVAKMDQISAIANKHDLAIIEDAAQSIGAKFKGKSSGTFGSFACFSAHPLKNLAAMGDAGFLVINDDTFNVDEVRQYRNHGLVDRSTQASWGINCRLDVLQCRILSHRLKSLDNANLRRREIADIYAQTLDQRLLEIPKESEHEFNVYHTYTIKTPHRDTLKEQLNTIGIGSAIHYPTPIHLQAPSRLLGYKVGDFPVTERLAMESLALPVQPHLTDEQIEIISTSINNILSSL